MKALSLPLPGSAARRFAVTATWILLANGCTTVTEKINGWVASDVDVLAVVDGRVLRGYARFYDHRQATFTLSNTEGMSLVCQGPLRFTSSTGGTVALTCSDGRTSQVAFAALTPLSGSGQGSLHVPAGAPTMMATAAMAESGKAADHSPASVALAYGMPPQRAAAYLSLPVDKLVPPKPSQTAKADAAPQASN